MAHDSFFDVLLRQLRTVHRVVPGLRNFADGALKVLLVGEAVPALLADGVGRGLHLLRLLAPLWRLDLKLVGAIAGVFHELVARRIVPQSGDDHLRLTALFLVFAFLGAV